MSKHSSVQLIQVSQSNKNDQSKLISVENKLYQTTHQIIQKDIETIETQRQKIQKFTGGIYSILKKINEYKEECKSTQKTLQAQVEQLDQKTEQYEREFRTKNKDEQHKREIESLKKEYLSQWQRRIKLAKQINVDALADLDLTDRKSKSNQVFKWIITSIYGEADNKYYWPNFRHQVFLRDDGVDFKERLGKINASSAKQHQIVKTEDFLKNYNQISSCSQFKKTKKQLETLKQIAQIFLNCYKKSQEIRQLQKLIQKSKLEGNKFEQENHRWKARSDALKQRLQTNNQYLNALKKIQEQLLPKPQMYKQKEQVAKEVISKLKSSSQNGNIAASSGIVINIGQEARDKCQCNIF